MNWTVKIQRGVLPLEHEKYHFEPNVVISLIFSISKKSGMSAFGVISHFDPVYQKLCTSGTIIRYKEFVEQSQDDRKHTKRRIFPIPEDYAEALSLLDDDRDSNYEGWLD